jgi:hypothetical protein
MFHIGIQVTKGEGDNEKDYGWHGVIVVGVSQQYVCVVCLSDYKMKCNILVTQYNWMYLSPNKKCSDNERAIQSPSCSSTQCY